MKKILFSFMLTVLSYVSFAQNSVVDIIVNSTDHDTLEAAVIAAELADDLSGPGPFTVFAPTDAAFAALPAGTIETLLADPTGTLAQILLYHVVAGQALSTDLSDGQIIATLQGQTVEVTINADGVFINDAQVTVADITATNGVVHVIDAVLLPPAPQPTTTVVDVIVNSDVHNTLEAAVVAAGLVETLSGTGPFTVFAPTDAAFAALPAGTVETLLADPTGTLTQILLYHVVSAAALSTTLSDGQTITTLLGEDITVTIDANGVMINNATVVVADILTTNGVVHVIDAVLLPPSPQPTNTILDIVVNSADHNTLEAAVIAAGLDDELSGPGPLTVFAPTDAAFAALPAGTVEALLANIGELQNILLYHVASGSVLSTDLTNGQEIPTLTFFPPLVVTIDNNGVMINNAMVTVADIVADNGVIHVIDAVLLPQQPNSVSTIETTKLNIQNPVAENINIPSNGNSNVQIFSTTGQVVYSQNFNGAIDIDTRNLSSGTYLLKVEAENFNGVTKIVK
jgi:uncharacterized surface protein with fasciclin (FAS1) repeats